jgi:nucleoside-diphosphate-sugar epimerase
VNDGDGHEVPDGVGMGAPGLTLVTGASGFVGSAVAKALRKAGHQVRVLVRASSPRTNIDPADAIAVGDVCDRSAVSAALHGVRYMIHTAADYRLWAPNPADIFRTNVDGTRILMEEAPRPMKAGRSPKIAPSAPTRKARSLPSGWSRTWWNAMDCRR